MPSEIVGPATLVISQGFSAFATFLPKLSDVRKADAELNPDIVGDVRLGEVAAFTLCMGMGAVVSSLTGSPIPAFVGLLVGLALLFVYETALWGHKPMNPKTSQGVRATDA
jgi:hypothetical protein